MENFVPPDVFQARGRTAAFKRRVDKAAKCLGSAKEALADFGRGCAVFGLSKGQYSMIDLADAVLSITGPADVACWTWCIAEYEAQAFGAFLRDDRLRSFRLVCDWSMPKRDLPLIGELQERFGLDSIRVTKNHAKLVTVSTVDGWRVVIRGSMNLNFNPRFEQFDVSDDPAIYAVVDEVMHELWARGKALPVRNLRHADAADLLNAGEVTHAPPAWAEHLTQKRWW